MVETDLRELVIRNYGNISAFVEKIGMAKSTFSTILKRGVNSASIDNIIKICKELGISADALAEGKIVPSEERPVSEASVLVNNIKINVDFLLIDGEYLTEDEFFIFSEMLDLSIEMVRRMRNK
jgi:transcriptional regulator with XRE-family HTH domain